MFPLVLRYLNLWPLSAASLVQLLDTTFGGEVAGCIWSYGCFVILNKEAILRQCPFLYMPTADKLACKMQTICSSQRVCSLCESCSQVACSN